VRSNDTRRMSVRRPPRARVSSRRASSFARMNASTGFFPRRCPSPPAPPPHEWLVGPVRRGSGRLRRRKGERRCRDRQQRRQQRRHRTPSPSAYSPSHHPCLSVRLRFVEAPKRRISTRASARRGGLERWRTYVTPPRVRLAALAGGRSPRGRSVAGRGWEPKRFVEVGPPRDPPRGRSRSAGRARRDGRGSRRAGTRRSPRPPAAVRGSRVCPCAGWRDVPPALATAVLHRRSLNTVTATRRGGRGHGRCDSGCASRWRPA
jgi:hypothetical protein